MRIRETDPLAGKAVDRRQQDLPFRTVASYVAPANVVPQYVKNVGTWSGPRGFRADQRQQEAKQETSWNH